MNSRTNHMRTISLGGIRDAARETTVSLFTLPERLLGILTLWQGRIEERRQLRNLDARTLKDVGLSRCDVEHEASKPFWAP